jgi:hypothetical protein
LAAAATSANFNIHLQFLYEFNQIHSRSSFFVRSIDSSLARGHLTTRLGMPVTGTFVYQKKNRSNPRPGADACEIKCKKLSCDIQRCISRLPATRTRTSSATVNHSKCDYAVDKYNACCERVKALEARAAGGEDASSA